MTSQQPQPVEEEQVQLLERLCNACAVSGDESEVRAIVLEQVSPHAEETSTAAAAC
jgi:putative aminopeptidase FrvX